MCYCWQRELSCKKGREEVIPSLFVVQRIKIALSGRFSGCLFMPLVGGIGLWPGIVHFSFAAVASASRVFESVGVFLYHCQVSEVIKRFLGVNSFG